MDRQVFIQNLQVAQRKKILLLRIGLSCLFVAICVTMWLSKTSITPHGMLLFKGGLVVFFAGLVYVLVNLVQKTCRRLDLYCPNCNRNLSGPVRQKVLDSGQCFQCGMKLLD